MGKKAYMGPMQDPNGINAQILPIWVPYIHVCWGININIFYSTENVFFFFFFSFFLPFFAFVLFVFDILESFHAYDPV